MGHAVVVSGRLRRAHRDQSRAIRRAPFGHRLRDLRARRLADARIARGAAHGKSAANGQHALGRRGRRRELFLRATTRANRRSGPWTSGRDDCPGCVGLSALAYEQYFIRNPADRAEYAADPDAMLQKYGQWMPPGSREREAFELRLASKEPLATFALTNSLAGFLTPWFVLLLAILLLGAKRSQNTAPPVAPDSRLPRLAFSLRAIAAVVVVGCLLLTKSRSAWVGTLVGCGGLIATAASYRFLTWRRLLIGAAALAALVAATIAARGLDREVLTEAGKSLGYRLQYWRSSWAMILDHPWVGCGAGNFQDYYTQYKLPEASEEIRDPHNFLLELAATSGIPAALAMLGVLALFVGGIWRAEKSAEAARISEDLSSPADDQAQCWIAGGAAAGLALAWWIGWMVALPFDAERLAIVGVVGAAVWVGLASWRRGGELRPTWVAMAVLALSVHHLAAGGISFPGVAGSFWLLLALGAATVPTNPRRKRAAFPLAARGAHSCAGDRERGGRVLLSDRLSPVVAGSDHPRRIQRSR